LGKGGTSGLADYDTAKDEIDDVGEYDYPSFGSKLKKKVPAKAAQAAQAAQDEDYYNDRLGNKYVGGPTQLVSVS
jgi:hypothetical protein